MKLSEWKIEEILATPATRRWDFLLGEVCPFEGEADLALLLGTGPEIAVERARGAAELYHRGQVKVILASGGVKWDFEGESITEAELMKKVLLREGVPEEVVLLDNDSRTTLENMLCSTLVISRNLKISRVSSVVIVTSKTHIKRSLALAKALLPRKFSIFGYPTDLCDGLTREEWLEKEENRKRMDSCITLIKRLVSRGVVEDMEF